MHLQNFWLLANFYIIKSKLLNIEIKIPPNMASTSFQPCIYPVPDLVYSPEGGKKNNSTFHITSSAPFQCPYINQQLNWNFFLLKSCPSRSSLNATSPQELFLISSAARYCCLKVSNALKTRRFFLVLYYVPLLDFSVLTDKKTTSYSFSIHLMLYLT